MKVFTLVPYFNDFIYNIFIRTCTEMTMLQAESVTALARETAICVYAFMLTPGIIFETLIDIFYKK